MSSHSHDWIDVTQFGDDKQRLFCNCGATAWRTFTPVNISDREDAADLVTVLIYNDGSNRVVRVPVPMKIRAYTPIEVDQ